MGAGVPMQDGDIAFKSNFASWDPATGIVARRRADRRFEEAGPALCQHLDGAPVLPWQLQHLMSPVGQACVRNKGIFVLSPSNRCVPQGSRWEHAANCMGPGTGSRGWLQLAETPEEWLT